MSASSVVRMTSGSASRPRVNEPAIIESPKPRALTKSAMPKRPKMMEGMLPRLLVMMRMKRTIFPLPAYSVV